MSELTRLKTFARIADRGSISAAARDLGLSQATASRQLAQLEDRLGASLILRTTHDLTLTETGRAVLAEARQLLSQWDVMVETAAEHPDAPLSGSMRVVAPIALGQHYLTEALLQFCEDHPDLQVTWLLSDAEQRVAEAGLDIWVRIGMPEDDTLIVEPVATVERLLVGARPVTAQSPEGFGDPIVALDLFEGGHIPLQSSTGDTQTLKGPVRMRMNDIFALRDAALAGMGAAILPHWLIKEELEAGTLVDLFPDWRAAELPVTIAYLPALRRSRRVQAMRAAMRDTIVGIAGLRPV